MVYEMKLSSTGRRVEADRLGAAEQLGHGLASLVAVVLGQLVDVHADEAVGEPLVETAPELHRVLHRLLAVVEPGADRFAQHLRQVVQHLLAEIAPRDVDAERQRQARLEQPPLAEVDRLLEAERRVRQLSLVDQQARVCAPLEHLVEDLVEREGRGNGTRRGTAAT